MDVYEIAKLRKSGNINEAYNAMLEYYPGHTDSKDCVNVYSWILRDLACACAEKSDVNGLSTYIDKLCLLSTRSESLPAVESLAWGLLKMFKEFAQKEWNDYSMLDELISPIVSTHYHDGSKVASLICSGVCKLKNWKRSAELLLPLSAYLLPADYLPYKTNNGRQLMSLAENCNCKICNWLIQGADTELIASYIPTHRALMSRHPEYTYPAYYLAKMLLVCGENKIAIRELKPFAKRKAGEFWVWELLGDAQESDEECLPYYCKALLCRAKDEFLVKLYEKVGFAFARVEQYSIARALLDKAFEIRRKQQWNAGFELQDVLHQDWYQQTIPEEEFRKTLEKVSEEAETYLYGESKSFNGTLRLNQEKGFGFVDHIYIDRKLIRKLKDGMKVKGRAIKSFDKKKNREGWKAITIQRA